MSCEIIMRIPSQQSIVYPIKIGTDLLRNLENYLPDDCSDKKIVIITDDQVYSLYSDALKNAFATFNPLCLTFPAGEKSKNNHTKQSLEQEMISNHCDRDTLIIALGGGVVGDIAGFIASTYLRGITYIQIPTTLLAMVDSSVGGKTGINTAEGKNLIGAFWQPKNVIADIHCLLSLSKEQLINGLIEALKMFLTSNEKSFYYATHHISDILTKNISVLTRIVRDSIKIKVAVVSADEKENNQRMILNFGHTIGHAIEKIMGYEILHGYAVGFGILVEAKISQLLGILSFEDYQLIQTIFSTLCITGDQLKKLDPLKIIQATKNDKKVKENAVRYVLLKKIGQVFVENGNYAHTISDEIVKQALLEVSEKKYYENSVESGGSR